MKILLIGPYPPPHGGISTHIAELQRRWVEAGVPCRVLDTGQAGMRFAWRLLHSALTGWTLHAHTNGHNTKSWLLAGFSGLAGRISGDAVLTLHSGMVPRYLGDPKRRVGDPPPVLKLSHILARMVCSSFGRVVCVSEAIREALEATGVEWKKLEVRPAFLDVPRSRIPLSPLLQAWMRRHSPVFSAALFFRPEYGFELLAASLAKLRRRYPSLGCVVMGSGEQQAAAESLIRTSGLQDTVLLAGDVSHDTCLAVISRSDMFLRPTLEDGDSVSVREALVLGIPVVASRAGTRPEGVVLFRTGDERDFCSKVELALKERDHASA